MGNIRSVVASSIRIPEVKLRTVDTSGEQYVGVVQSIRQVGFKGVITGREGIDPVTGEKFIELVDGLHRLTAFKEVLGADSEINIQVDQMSQMDLLRTQFVLNHHKVETKPVQYGEHIKQMMALDPMLTVGSLAKTLGVTSTYIEDRLNLSKNIKDESIRKAIDEGVIPAVNAIALAKLPQEEQPNFLSAATGSSAEFLPAVRARVAEINAAKRAGLAAKPIEFQAVQKARSPAELKELTEAKLAEIIGNATTPMEAAKRVAAWCINADPASVEAQRAKWEADRKADEERKAKKAEEKAAKARAAVA